EGGEYRRISRELRESVRGLSACIAELRALEDYGDGYEALRLLEHLCLENMEKRIHLRLMMKETQLKITKKGNFMVKLKETGGVWRILAACCGAIVLKATEEAHDWTNVLSYFYRNDMAEDIRFTTKINMMRGEMADVCEKRINLSNEMRSLRGIIAPEKAVEFLKDTLRKNDAEMA
nr:hypothetical protein [Tanacetum cinerariifolium]